MPVAKDNSQIYVLFQTLKANLLCLTLPWMHGSYSLRTIQSKWDFSHACRLLYRRYRKRGYCEPNASSMHFSPYMFENKSRTFVLADDSTVRGTVSIFPDGPSGVPLEEAYPAYVEELRCRGKTFAEVGLLATELDSASNHLYSLGARRKMLPVFLLFKGIYNYAIELKLDCLLIVVHPKHAQLYRFLGFQQFAEVLSYEGACGNPALPMVMYMRGQPSKMSWLCQWFLTRNLLRGEDFSSPLSEAPVEFMEYLYTAEANASLQTCEDQPSRVYASGQFSVSDFSLSPNSKTLEPGIVYEKPAID